MGCMPCGDISMGGSSPRQTEQQRSETALREERTMRVTRRTAGPVAIAYEIAGSGPLVVFLHGIGGNRSNWEEQVAYFAARFCAVAWDARGYGASDDPPQTLQFRDYADDL